MVCTKTLQQILQILANLVNQEKKRYEDSTARNRLSLFTDLTMEWVEKLFKYTDKLLKLIGGFRRLLNARLM